MEEPCIRSARPLTVLDLGVCEYGEVYDLQLNLVAKKKREPQTQDYLILVEHPDVYTFGRKSAQKNSVNGFHIERGGEDTYHNPGQLVGYPIISLHDGERDLHRYLRNLEATVVQLLGGFGLRSDTLPGATGVWVRERTKKIASIGVAVKGWVTYHGVALNVTNDLSGFGKISPCGFQSQVMTSLEREVTTSVSMCEVKNRYLAEFTKVFDRYLLD